MNMNIQKISLVFMFICIIALFVENRNMNNKFKSLENFGNDNIEHLDNTDEDRVREIIKEEYTHDIEAIRNLGIISKSLLTGKNYHNTSPTDLQHNMLKIPANFMVMGNSLAVSVGTVIMWALSTPPPPNNQSNIVPFGPGNNADSWQLGSDDYWAPCTGATYNGKKTPDLRNRLPLGHGSWGGALNSYGGGDLPLRNHSHWRNNHDHADHVRAHTAAGYSGGGYQLVYSKDQNEHAHGQRTGAGGGGSSNTTGHDAGNNVYNPRTTPYYSIVQYWMRVR